MLFQSVDEDAAPAPGHLPIAPRAGIVRTLAYRATVTAHFLAPECEVASLAYWTRLSLDPLLVDQHGLLSGLQTLLP